jgi:Fic family protein
VPDLIRAAIAHYQFETIHPYNDGNGRIGRLLITLYLVSKGVLKKPSLYLSDFFERNRSSYIDGLMRVRLSNDLNHWIRFFLGGVLETARKGSETFQALLKFREEAEGKAMAMGKRAHNARAAIDFMYQHPGFAAKDLCAGIGVTQPTADALIQALVGAGLLIEATGQMRNRIFVFDPYLKLFAK